MGAAISTLYPMFSFIVSGALASLRESRPICLCAQGLQGQLRRLGVESVQSGCSLGADTSHLQDLWPPEGPASMWSWIQDGREPPGLFYI